MSGGGNNYLAVLAADIRALHTGIRRNTEQIARDAIEAGKQLIEAKSLLAHGEWLPWLRDHVDIGERRARLYMRLARSGLEIGAVADLGLKAAERLLSNGEDQPPVALPALGDLPLCLATPPEPGQGLRILQDWPRAMIAVLWPSQQYPGFYHVLVFDSVGILEGLRRPLAWIGIPDALDWLRFPIADDTEVERTRDTDFWDSLLPLLTADNAEAEEART